jgi:hypothetical protein
MSASSIYVISVWLIVLALFFAAIYAAAKSDKPGTKMAEFLLLSSGIEGAFIYGIWRLIKRADQWRDELDASDAAAIEAKEKAKGDGNDADA